MSSTTLLCISCSCHSVMCNTFLYHFGLPLYHVSVSQRDFPLFSPQFKDSSSCLAFTRHLALLVRMLSPVVSLHPYFFLRALLLLAGDVEANPGPIQGKEMQYQVSIVVWNCMELILWIMDCPYFCSAYTFMDSESLILYRQATILNY